MKLEDMKYYHKRAGYLDWDEFCDYMIQPEDDGDTCEEKIRGVCCRFPSESLEAFKYFKTIYDDIPVKHRMRCLLNNVYQNYRLYYAEVLQMIAEYLKNETEELKAYRLDTNRELLKELVDDTENFTVYRGTAEGNLLPEWAISWSLNKEVADFFIEHHKTRHNARFGITTNIEVSIEDVLYYSNGRNEEEVYLIPQMLKDGNVPEDEEALESLDEFTFLRDYEYTEEFEEWENHKDDFEVDSHVDNSHLDDKPQLTMDKLQVIVQMVLDEFKGDSDTVKKNNRLQELIQLYEEGKLNI